MKAPIPQAELERPAGRSVDNAKANRLDEADRPVHDWYRFVLSYPPHLVRDYLRDFGLTSGDTVLDPFCGTGTTIVESKRCGVSSVGIEANHFAHFASSVKVDWQIDPDALMEHAHDAARAASRVLARQGIDDAIDCHDRASRIPLDTLGDEESKLLLTDSISPLPLHKTLVLLQSLKAHESDRVYRHLLLALAHVLVYSASNLHFGPEVGVGKPKTDSPVIGAWLRKVEQMAADVRAMVGGRPVSAVVERGDARLVDRILSPQSINAVITSPPYPNEKDYTRTTRLESVILGFISSKEQLRAMKQTLVRSNTRNVYKGDDDDRWIAEHPEILALADEIERRRIALGKTSGFERMYGRVTRLYFGGMARHLAGLRAVLRPGAQLAYVVGDQASYLKVMIRTGQLLGDIAQALGYELVRIDLFRTRFATATRAQLREEVVVLKWNGDAQSK